MCTTGRGAATVTLQDKLDKVQMMQRRHLPECRQIRGLARQHVVARDWLQRFRRERQIHRVARLPREINREPAENGVHRGDLSEPPAPVHAIAAFGEQDEGFHMLAVDLSGDDHLLELFFHRFSK